MEQVQLHDAHVIGLHQSKMAYEYDLMCAEFEAAEEEAERFRDYEMEATARAMAQAQSGEEAVDCGVYYAALDSLFDRSIPF